MNCSTTTPSSPDEGAGGGEEQLSESIPLESVFELEPFEKMVNLNNRAVAVFMLQNNCDRSLLLFRASLEAPRCLLGKLEAHFGRNNTTGGPMEPQHVLPPPLPDDFCSDSPEIEQVELVLSELIKRSSKIPIMINSVYLRAFDLSSAPGAYSRDPVANISIAFAMVAFNMAIVCHAQALDSSDFCFEDASQVRLHLSREFYILALAILHSIGVPNEVSCGHACIDLVSMAVHNNLAQISLSLAEYDQSRRHTQILASFCAAVRPDLHDQRTRHVLMWHKLSFLLNVFFIQIPTMAGAA